MGLDELKNIVLPCVTTETMRTCDSGTWASADRFVRRSRPNAQAAGADVRKDAAGAAGKKTTPSATICGSGDGDSVGDEETLGDVELDADSVGLLVDDAVALGKLLDEGTLEADGDEVAVAEAADGLIDSDADTDALPDADALTLAAALDDGDVEEPKD